MYLINNKKAAAYIRLSSDEEIQQTSIDNQLEIITAYCNQNNLVLIDIYIDDGYTGTIFNRPAFKRMLQDLDAGIVNCVITKDVSRLGRTMLGVGRYIDEYFVNNNIRYISIMEGYDSAVNNNEESMGIRLFLNDYYAKECSKRTFNRLRKKAKETNITALGCYGYKKDKDGNLLIDEEVVDNVRYIFNEYKNGKSNKEIADSLNERNILTPLAYKKQRGYYLNRKKEETMPLWNDNTICDILKNGQYTGDAYNLMNARRRCDTSYKRHSPLIIKNTHPAIISHELFEEVKKIRESRKTKTGEPLNIEKLNKMLYCPVCGKAYCASTSKNRKSFTYSHNDCSVSFNNNLIHDTLHRLALKHLNEIKTDPKKFERKVIESKIDLKQFKMIMDELSLERNKLDDSIQSLFEEYIEGNLSKEEYQERLEIFNDDLNYLTKEENKLKLSKYKETQASKQASDFLMEIFNMNIKHISKVELIKRVINKVILTKVNGEMIIHNIEYKF
jgi:DNA invertase Pin-like site-specific DNA recombinase